jgi:hypothetical protein
MAANDVKGDAAVISGLQPPAADEVQLVQRYLNLEEQFTALCSPQEDHQQQQQQQQHPSQDIAPDSSGSSHSSPATCINEHQQQQLQLQLLSAFSALSVDMQAALISSPARHLLLQQLEAEAKCQASRHTSGSGSDVSCAGHGSSSSSSSKVAWDAHPAAVAASYAGLEISTNVDSLLIM